MTTYPKPTVSITALLAAAVELQQIHGKRFATYFLEEFGINESVIHELLKLPTTNNMQNGQMATGSDN